MCVCVCRITAQASNALGANGNPSSNPTLDRQRKLAAMFSPPTKIMFMGDFQMARQASRPGGKVGKFPVFSCGYSSTLTLWNSKTVFILLNYIQISKVGYTQQFRSEADRCFFLALHL